jgi:AcrR family transcriptional regulator
MPRVVDLSTRRSEIAEAVWRVIGREGLQGASVRGVALEAGLSMGSLRHYFDSQSQLHSFAMRLVMDRISARVEALPPTPDARLWAEQVLEQLLPLDADRRVESEVWLAFTARALVDPALGALRDEGFDRLRQVCHLLLTRLSAADDGPHGLDLELEAVRLHALVDGLLVHGAVRAALVDAVAIRRVLHFHLDAIGRS